MRYTSLTVCAPLPDLDSQQQWRVAVCLLLKFALFYIAVEVIVSNQVSTYHHSHVHLQ